MGEGASPHCYGGFELEEDTDGGGPDNVVALMAPRAESGWSWRSQVFRVRYRHEIIALREDATPCFQVAVLLHLVS
jgi:hypothetical protein